MRHGFSRATIIQSFSRVANGKKRKQTLFSLMNGDVHILGTENILEHASVFYR
jgi:hypothetical protein